MLLTILTFFSLNVWMQLRRCLSCIQFRKGTRVFVDHCLPISKGTHYLSFDNDDLVLKSDQPSANVFNLEGFTCICYNLFMYLVLQFQDLFYLFPCFTVLQQLLNHQRFLPWWRRSRCRKIPETPLQGKFHVHSWFEMHSYLLSPSIFCQNE